MDQKIIDLGAGEIILTSIDKEGTKRGPDFYLAETASKISHNSSLFIVEGLVLLII